MGARIGPLDWHREPRYARLGKHVEFGLGDLVVQLNHDLDSPSSCVAKQGQHRAIVCPFRSSDAHGADDERSQLAEHPLYPLRVENRERAIGVRSEVFPRGVGMPGGYFCHGLSGGRRSGTRPR